MSDPVPSVWCARCGSPMPAIARACPQCGAPNLAANVRGQAGTGPGPASEKSYAVAVSLCGIFGILGIHHFYLGNALHGLFDLGLFLAAIAILLSPGLQSDGWITVAILLLAADLLHTMFVFYRLITGAERDGKGRPVPVPGNRR